MPRAALLPVLLILMIALGAFLKRDQVAVAVFTRAVPNMLAGDARTELGDGLGIGICGAGGPLADPQRSGPCIAIIAGDNLLLVDSGSGAARNLALMRLPAGELDAVLLTHFHSDHIDGLGETGTMRWAGGDHDAPLPVIGPAGVSQVVEGFNLAYAADKQYRYRHHGDQVAPLKAHGLKAQPFQLPPEGAAEIVWDSDGLRISAFAVSHEPVTPAVGYRVDYKSRSVVISGDTSASANLARFAEGVDLLLHDAMDKRLVGIMQQAAAQTGNRILEKIAMDIVDYHASPVEAANSAQKAGAAHLVYYHIVPPLRLPGLGKAFLQGVGDAYDGPVTLSRDGMLFLLPTGSDEILLIEKGL